MLIAISTVLLADASNRASTGMLSLNADHSTSVEREAHGPLPCLEPEGRVAIGKLLRHPVLRLKGEYRDLGGNRSNEVEELAIAGNPQLLAVGDTRTRKALRRAVANQGKHAVRCDRKYTHVIGDVVGDVERLAV